MTILTPCFANARTMAIPMPLLPPVTMATFPLRLIVISPLQLMVDSTKLHGDGRRRGALGGVAGRKMPGVLPLRAEALRRASLDTEDQTRGREPDEQGLGSSSSIAPTPTANGLIFSSRAS